ncbi:MAG: STAS domain-containing protein [Phycisphaerae bacterium]
MNITAETYGRAVILYLKGELTVDTLEAVRKSVAHHIEDEQIVDVVFSMQEVPFVDSAGLEYLLELQDALAERLGQVKFVRCDESIRKIFEVTRLDSDFEVMSDVADAVKTIQA